MKHGEKGKYKQARNCFPIIDELELDELVGFPNIRITGDRRVLVSGVRFVNELSEEKIELDLDKIKAQVCGCKMRLVYVARGMVKIEGRICTMNLCRYSDLNNET